MSLYYANINSIGRAPDFAHAAGAELGGKAIVGNRLPVHAVHAPSILSEHLNSSIRLRASDGPTLTGEPEVDCSPVKLTKSALPADVCAK